MATHGWDMSHFMISYLKAGTFMVFVMFNLIKLNLSAITETWSEHLSVVDVIMKCESFCG
jgi:hypothetical protein